VKGVTMKRFLLAAACAAAVCGCTPKAVTMATVDTVTHVCVCADGGVAMYLAGGEQQDLLRNAFETWKRAGFEGFSPSFVTYVPTVSVIGKLEDGTYYSVDFGPDVVVVNEVDADGESSQYVRDATPADKRFRLFILAYIADGKFPKAENAEAKSGAAP